MLILQAVLNERDAAETKRRVTRFDDSSKVFILKFIYQVAEIPAIVHREILLSPAQITQQYYDKGVNAKVITSFKNKNLQV